MTTQEDKYWQLTEKMNKAENRKKFLDYHAKRSTVTKVIIGNKQQSSPILNQYLSKNEGK